MLWMDAGTGRPHNRFLCQVFGNYGNGFGQPGSGFGGSTRYDGEGSASFDSPDSVSLDSGDSQDSG